MGPTLNLCQFVGRLGHDAELRYTGKQTPILSFSLAVTMYEEDAQGNQVERAEWVNCVIIGKLGEAVKPKMLKGTQVFFSGNLKNRKWTGKDGQERHAVEVVNWNRHAHQLVITAPGKPKAADHPAAPVDGGQREAPAAPSSPKEPPPPYDPATDTDLPF